tara:strand:+ start:177 stop:395 length:219 start_codon:yes stop_codon:yes gene_type:complete
MNDMFVFIYGLMFAAVVGGTFAFMWRMTGMLVRDMEKPKKVVHPEMENIQPGESLLVFKEVEREEENEDSQY